MMPVAVCLVHHPVLGRDGNTLTTTITTVDLHDMARSVCVYGLAGLYVVHPFASQRQLTERIKQHWVEGSGRRRIPDRATALELLHVIPSVEAACEIFVPGGGRAGVELWTTSAKEPGEDPENRFSFAAARQAIVTAPKAVLICFGTGWGLAPELMQDADRHLEPIRGRAATGYNHLSVRAACAITLDRLFG